MASVYERDDRDFLYASIRDPASLRWRSIATPFRKDSPAARRNALLWAATRDTLGLEGRRLRSEEAWARWVADWLTQAFSYNANTLTRYSTAWAHLNEFLAEKKIAVPRQLNYQHASAYLAWRAAQKRHRGTPINRNTAIVEIKIMSRILREARRRGFIDVNPWTQLGLRRENVRHTPPMADDEIATTRAALDHEEGHLPLKQRWMTVSFELALHHGARLSATMVPMERVHLDPKTDDEKNFDRISFETKGRNGVAVIKTLPLNPAVRPMIERLRREGATVTCELPRMAAKFWWSFRQRHGLGHLRFHSTRSTVATQLARNDVPLQKAMELLGHKSTAVHLAYLHLNAADVGGAVAGISFGSAKPGMHGNSDALKSKP